MQATANGRATVTEPLVTQDRINTQRPVKHFDRWLRRMKRMGMFGDDTHGTEISQAMSICDLTKTLAMVHDTFEEVGLLDVNPTGLRVRMFEAVPELATFIAKEWDGSIAGSMSLIGDSPELGLPADKVFKKELDLVRAGGSRICEGTNQAVRKTFRNSSILTELLRCVFAQAVMEGYDEILATVGPSKGQFFKLLGFREITPVRSYSTKVDDPVVVLARTITEADIQAYDRPQECGRTGAFDREFLFTTNPYKEYVPHWEALRRQLFKKPDQLRKLFVADSHFLQERSLKELDILRDRWGAEVFDQVQPHPSIDAA